MQLSSVVAAQMIPVLDGTAVAGEATTDFLTLLMDIDAEADTKADGEAEEDAPEEERPAEEAQLTPQWVLAVPVPAPRTREEARSFGFERIGPAADEQPKSKAAVKEAEPVRVLPREVVLRFTIESEPRPVAKEAGPVLEANGESQQEFSKQERRDERQEPRLQSKPEPRLEPKAEPKLEPKPEPKPEHEPEPRERPVTAKPPVPREPAMAFAPTHADSSQATRTPVREARTEPAAASLRVVEPQPAPAAAKGPAIREIAIQVQGTDARPVDLHIVDNRGKVHVEVRTDNPQLASSLRENAGELVEKLDNAGYRPSEAVQRSEELVSRPPAISAMDRIEAREHHKMTTEREQAQSGGNGSEGNQHQQQQHGHPRGNRPRWLEEIRKNFFANAVQQDEEDSSDGGN